MLKAVLENVTNLRPQNGLEHQWSLKLRCCGCREVSDKWRYISADELHDIPNSRGHAHYVEKCPFCGKQNLIDGSAKPIDKSEEFVTVIKFECRGTEPAEFQPTGEWQCDSSLSNATFRDIDISEAWADYDEKGGEPVTIDDVVWKFK